MKHPGWALVCKIATISYYLPPWKHLFSPESDTCTVKLQLNRFPSNDNLELNIFLLCILYQKRNEHKFSPTMCQVWLLGASLGWLHLILQARGLSDPPGLTLLLIPQTSTFSPLLCLFPLSVTPLPWFFLILQVSVQSQLLGRSSSTNCASGLPTSFPSLCLSCVCLSQPFNY